MLVSFFKHPCIFWFCVVPSDYRAASVCRLWDANLLTDSWFAHVGQIIQTWILNCDCLITSLKLLSVSPGGGSLCILVCVCLHANITCVCQLRCADAHLMMECVQGGGASRRRCSVYVYFDYCTPSPPAETLKCGQTHADWWPSIMHMAVGSGNPRYHQGQLVCPCWKPPPPHLHRRMASISPLMRKKSRRKKKKRSPSSAE